MEQNVMDLVSFYEQTHNMPRRNARLAHPQAVRPGSAENLLAQDGSFDGLAMAQMQAHNQNRNLQMLQIPATPQKQARYGFPITPQSIHRNGAPQTLTIPSQIPYAVSQQSIYAPTANSNQLAYTQYMPTSADRASFPDLDSPMQQASMPYARLQRSHTRNNSTFSLASSVGSAGSLFLPNSGLEYSDPSMGFASRSGTPPVSPKKRKSPTKSPSKSKDRPNFLDKAIMRNTGVTQEQINTYIGEPNAADPKNWRCLWDGCSHLAARKENIRAHVQTHLGDRPYECPECHADFVRSHDFTRHYTTHVDSRDFKCPDCPQAFNRADALQRHRDRDFCNGPPPASPSKIRRTIEAIDKKRDVMNRRSKKQASRKRTTKRQDSAELSDDFWSTSEGTPEYLSSDAGTPEMIMDGLLDSASQEVSGPSQVYVPMERADFSSSTMRRNDEAMERMFAALSEQDSSSQRQVVSMSPPMSPTQTQPNLTQFSPSPKRAGHHQMTPPASRDSMLNFLSGPSIHGNQTVSSGPSLPDLSSASPSPLAFEPINDFDDFCNTLNGSTGDNSWLDPRINKSSIDTSFDFTELVDSKGSSNSWIDDTEDLFGSF